MSKQDTEIKEPTSYQTTMLLALMRTGKHVYEGTVGAGDVALRRARNKRAKIARRANRG
jgi:hypothetical protein